MEKGGQLLPNLATVRIIIHLALIPRRDFSNGYLIAEIFSWYYPQDIQMHSFDNGASTETKMGNWSIIQRVRKSLILLGFLSDGLNAYFSK